MKNAFSLEKFDRIELSKKTLACDDDDCSSYTYSTESVSTTSVSLSSGDGSSFIDVLTEASATNSSLSQRNRVASCNQREPLSVTLKDLNLSEVDSTVFTSSFDDFSEEGETCLNGGNIREGKDEMDKNYGDGQSNDENDDDVVTSLQVKTSMENKLSSLLFDSADNVSEEDSWNSSLDDVIFGTTCKVSKRKKKTETKQNAVNFDKVHIRVYEQILGDNPTRASGPSISIGWRYEPEESFPLEERELLRKRRSDILMSRARRENIARKLGYSADDIACNVRATSKCKAQRLRTASNLNTQTVAMEEALEKARQTLLTRRMKLDFSLTMKNAFSLEKFDRIELSKKTLACDDDDCSSYSAESTSTTSVSLSSGDGSSFIDVLTEASATNSSLSQRNRVASCNQREPLSVTLKDLNLSEVDSTVFTSSFDDFSEEGETCLNGGNIREGKDEMDKNYGDGQSNDENDDDVVTSLQVKTSMENKLSSLLFDSADNVSEEDFWNSSLDDVIFGTTCKVSKREKKTETKQQAVNFDKVHIRVYEQILGDNPTRSSGPSISIGWRYEPEESFPLEERELLRKRRSHFRMSRARRENIARKLGYSAKDIACNARATSKSRAQRLRTASNLNTQTVAMEEALEKVRRKFAKMVRTREKTRSI